MTLARVGDRWVARSTYDERAVPKSAGFRWDGERREWWTADPTVAAKLAAHADASCAADLAARAAQATAAVESSRATDAEVDIPAPDGLSYMPFQRAGIAYCLTRFGYNGLKEDLTDGSRKQSPDNDERGVAEEGLGENAGGNAQTGHQSAASPWPQEDRGQFQGWERPSANGNGEGVGIEAGAARVSTGICDPDSGARHNAQPAVQLQGGFCESKPETRNRAGRSESSHDGALCSRSTQDRSARSSRVVCNSNPSQVRGVLIGDEPGLGKTIQALGVVNADASIRSVLVVCPASLRINWRREAERWLVEPRRIHVVESSDAPPADAEVVVVNYDRLIGSRSKLVRDAIMAREWDLAIVDECQALKDPKAQRTASVLGSPARKEKPAVPGILSRARRVICLTGTPILNRPVELQPVAGALAPVEFGNWWTFTGRYCDRQRTRWGLDVSGASHLDELQERLRRTIMIRRLKSEVLTDLPAKTRQVLVLPANGAAGAVRAEREAYDRLSEDAERERLAADLAHASGDAAGYDAALARLRGAASKLFTEMAACRHDTAVAKIPAVLDHVRALVEDGVRLLVFAHHHDVIDGICAGLAESKIEHVKLDGRDDAAARDEAVTRFQGDESVRVFVGGIRAAGVGLTLTAASTVVFAELDWTPAWVTQAEDRAHRIGQRQSVLVQHLVLDGSLDVDMARTIVAKQEVADLALDARARPAAVVDDAPVAPERERRPVRYPVATDEERAAAAQAVLAIDGRCDGVRRVDGQGWSRVTVGAGASLAEWVRAGRALTDGQVWLARRLVRIHHRQVPAGLAVALGVEAR